SRIYARLCAQTALAPGGGRSLQMLVGAHTFATQPPHTGVRWLRRRRARRSAMTNLKTGDQAEALERATKLIEQGDAAGAVAALQEGHGGEPNAAREALLGLARFMLADY